MEWVQIPVISVSKSLSWCSLGSSSFILLTKSLFLMSGSMTSAESPAERSTAGPCLAAPPPAPAGTWIPERMFCRSDSWMGAVGEEAEPPPEVAAPAAEADPDPDLAGAAAVGAAEDEAVVDGGAAEDEEPPPPPLLLLLAAAAAAASLALAEDLCLPDPEEGAPPPPRREASPPAPPPNSCISCCWLMLLRSDWSSVSPRLLRSRPPPRPPRPPKPPSPPDPPPREALPGAGGWFRYSLTFLQFSSSCGMEAKVTMAVIKPSY